MKRTILTLLVFASITLLSFIKESLNYEQIAFDYFMTDIFKKDFRDLDVVEFKGKTEDSFSNLGHFKFCLEPEEKLQSIIQNAIKGPITQVKEIRYRQVNNITIGDFTDNANDVKLYVFHSVRVADNFYVFLSVQKPNESLTRYVFEINPDGEILRYCDMK